MGSDVVISHTRHVDLSLDRPPGQSWRRRPGLQRPRDVVQAVLETGRGLTNSEGTTTHHLLICGDVQSHTDTQG